MGVQERVVTEMQCDVCKKQISSPTEAKIGALSARTLGARGRGEQWELALHQTCYRSLTSSATKPGGRAAPSRRKTAARPGARRRGRPPKKR